VHSGRYIPNVICIMQLTHALKTGTVHSSVTLVIMYQIIRRRNLEQDKISVRE
jgi:hypothetical protein